MYVYLYVYTYKYLCNRGVRGGLCCILSLLCERHCIVTFTYGRGCGVCPSHNTSFLFFFFFFPNVWACHPFTAITMILGKSIDDKEPFTHTDTPFTVFLSRYQFADLIISDHPIPEHQISFERRFSLGTAWDPMPSPRIQAQEVGRESPYMGELRRLRIAYESQ